MFHKIKVTSTVGTGETYLVHTDKDPDVMHKELQDKFKHEIGPMVSISYQEQWMVDCLSTKEYGKIDGIIHL